MHVAVSLLTLVPGAVGGTETYARGLLGAFAAAPERLTLLDGDAATRTVAAPDRVTVLASDATARTLAARGPVEAEGIEFGPGRGTDERGPVEAEGIEFGPGRGTAARGPVEAEATGRGTAARGPVEAQATGRGTATRRRVEVEVIPFALGRGTAARAAGLARGLAFPPAAARSLAAGADVVHFPLSVPIPRVPGAHVVTLHDVLHLDLPSAVPAAERAYRRWAYDRAARRATRVITVSEHARGRIAARLGISPDRIDAIPHGLDHARFRPDGDDAALTGLALPDAPFALYPANLWPHKNHRRLLEGLTRSDLQLVLTGATFGRLDALLAEAARLGVRDRVHHLGYVPAAAVAPLYRRARLVVFPSLYEGFGAPPLEAMACGCPVAASNTGAVAEACAGAAFAFDPTDATMIATALTRVAHDEGLRTELRAAGLERAAALTWERSAARHAESYAAAIAAPPRS